jgi:hypothetical protein
MVPECLPTAGIRCLAVYSLYTSPEHFTACTFTLCRSSVLLYTVLRYSLLTGAEVFAACTRYRNCVQPIQGAGAIYSQPLEHDGRVYNALSLMLLKLQYSNNRRHCLCIPPCLFQRICGLYDSTGRSNTLCTNVNLNM